MEAAIMTVVIGVNADSKQYLIQAPWTLVFPGLAIMLTVLGFNLMGDGLRDALDPKMKE